MRTFCFSDMFVESLEYQGVPGDVTFCFVFVLLFHQIHKQSTSLSTEVII